MEFFERTSAPTEETRYYKTNNPFFPTYSMFRNNGNCTDYAYFRFKEANALESCKLPTCNAESWFNKSMPYAKGNTPKVGAVVVWAKGKVGVSEDGAGHVAFVERVNTDGSILISESGWKSFLWKTRTLKAPYTINGYTLLGFIYSPNEFETPKVDTPFANKTDEELAAMVWRGELGNGADRVAKLGSRYDSVQALVNKGIGKQNTETVYVIKRGDTLTGIAKKFNTTINKLASDNNIKDVNRIYAGQRLIIK